MTNGDDKTVEIMLADYSTCMEQKRSIENIKWTLFGIFFPAILVVFGFMTDFFSKDSQISFNVSVIFSIMSLALIWGWVILSVRLDMGVSVREKHIKELENNIIAGGALSKLSETHCHEMATSKLSALPSFKQIFSVIVGIFSGISIWFPILITWDSLTSDCNCRFVSDVVLWILLFIFILLSGYLYRFFDDMVPLFNDNEKDTPLDKK